MKNKNIVILGDSYSTFAGYIPEGYACYYTQTSSGETDVHKVSETWWHQLVCETDSKLVLNNSWSGSTICYTGWHGVDCSKSSSFIYRFNKLCDEGFFTQNEADTVFIFGGTNDSWADSPLGELQFSDWQKEDLFSVLPAICFLMYKIKKELPDKDIICIINSELKPEITNAFVKACEYYKIKYIQLENINKLGGHPTIKGMAEIKNQLLDRLS